MPRAKPKRSARRPSPTTRAPTPPRMSAKDIAVFDLSSLDSDDDDLPSLDTMMARAGIPMPKTWASDKKDKPLSSSREASTGINQRTKRRRSSTSPEVTPRSPPALRQICSPEIQARCSLTPSSRTLSKTPSKKRHRSSTSVEASPRPVRRPTLSPGLYSGGTQTYIDLHSDDEDTGLDEENVQYVGGSSIPHIRLHGQKDFPDLSGDRDAAERLIVRHGGGADQQDPKLDAMVKKIPLSDNAPVGARRKRLALLRARGQRVDVEDTAADAEDKAKDIADIERAAERLGARKEMVSKSRRERIVRIDDRGEPVLLDNGNSHVGSVTHTPPGSQTPDDDTEVVQGEELGCSNIDQERFRDVTHDVEMWRLDGLGIRRSTRLYPYQILGLEWMVRQELLQRRTNAKPVGGFVFDEMGLGKTMQSIFTMAFNPPSDDEPGVTLIVAPVALLQQWKQEILDHTNPGLWKLYVHHGKDRLQSVQDIKRYDVVICSYNAIQASYPSIKRPKERMSSEEWEDYFNSERWPTRGIFHRMRFWRIILDEGQIIKNRASRTSLGCQELRAENTWVLTGTPIQNKLDDIFPLFRFVQHPDAGDLSKFKAMVDKPVPAGLAAQRVQAVLRGCHMRRLKNDIIAGQKLVDLPKKYTRMVELEFGPEERSIYIAVENHARTVINRFMSNGTLQQNYQGILVMLLRLRQVCNHPYLLLDFINQDFTKDDFECALSTATAADGDSPAPAPATSGLRKLLRTAERQPVGSNVEECPICHDAIEDAVMARCRHAFCRACIEGEVARLANAGQESACCPTCGKRIDAAHIVDIDVDSDPAYLDAVNGSSGGAGWLDRAILAAGGFSHSSKTIALRDQIMQWRSSYPDDRIILFSQFTKMLDICEHALSELGEACVRYQGGMSLTARQDALDTWRTSPDAHILLMSLRAGGVGLNLTSANRLVSVDCWWNGAVEDQAFARAHRLGQIKDVFVTRACVRNSVEVRILALQRAKRLLASVALGEGKGGLGKLSVNELAGLFGKVETRNGVRRLVADYDVDQARARAQEVGAARLQRLIEADPDAMAY